MIVQVKTISNCYFQNSPEQFNALVKLVQENPKGFSVLLEKNPKYKGLFNWINSSLPILADGVYQLRTKCHWIFNGLTDFPICPVCGQQTNYIGKNVKINVGYPTSCCKQCMYKNDERNNKKDQTMIAKYGGRSPLCSKEILAKAQATSLKNHGAKSSFCRESDVYGHLFDRVSERLNRKIINASQIPGHAEKCQETNFKRHGDPNYRNREKLIETNLSRRGVPYTTMDPEIQSKIKQTFMNRYGVDNPFKSEKVKAKIRESTLKHLGVEFSQQCPDIMRKSRKKYKYKDMTFDSKTELAYYIYMTDAGYSVNYAHDIVFKYEFDGIQHVYHPDFLIISPCGDKFLVEIKGDQFFNNDGTMKIPYRNKNWSDEKYIKRCQQEEAKHQCMIQNNVKIIRHLSDEMKIVFRYIKTKYGPCYLDTFKNTRN